MQAAAAAGLRCVLPRLVMFGESLQVSVEVGLSQERGALTIVLFWTACGATVGFATF